MLLPVATTAALMALGRHRAETGKDVDLSFSTCRLLPSSAAPPRGCSPVTVEGSYVPGRIIYHCAFSVHHIYELEIHKQGL